MKCWKDIGEIGETLAKINGTCKYMSKLDCNSPIKIRRKQSLQCMRSSTRSWIKCCVK